MPPLRRPAGLAKPRRSGAAANQEIVWLFDLDNTLHDCSRHIFQVIDSTMSKVMMDWLKLDRPEADRLRLNYWVRYGATAIGLEEHHGINADAFLEASHDFDVSPLVHAERGIANKLAQLPGRKILLTNAPERYARDVLKSLGILHHFELLWSINHMRLQGRIRCKPSVAMLRQLLARLRVPAHQVVLVDDTMANLRSARAVGMRTVLSHHPSTPHNARHYGRDLYIDLRLNRVGELLSRRHRELATGRQAGASIPSKQGRGRSASSATAW